VIDFDCLQPPAVVQTNNAT